MELEDFRKLLEHKKPFRDLSDEYKSDKFLRLYLKMYEYMLSIPKDEIVYKGLIDDIPRIRCGLLKYIECFLKAKDFNNWRNRVYELMTKKIHHTSFKKYELYYNSKAKEFWNIYVVKMLDGIKQTNNQKYKSDWYMQTKEFREKSKEFFLQNYGTDNPMKSKEVQEKSKETTKERYGKEYYSQTDECKEKVKITSMKNWGVENPSQSEKIKEKKKQTFLKNCTLNGFCKNGGHSKIADNFCTNLYSMLPDDIKPYTIFYEKDNKEYELWDKDRIYRYDFTFIRESDKVIIEFDGIYWHGLLENQKDVRGTPVEEIWKEDMDKQRFAESMGFTVIRVREDEYRENGDKILNSIVEVIENGIKE